MLFPKIVDVSEKGQIVIPAGMRQALGIKAKGKVYVVPDKKKKKLVIKPMEGKDIIEAAHGMLASGDGKSWTRELLEERRRDLIREETKFDRFFEKSSRGRRKING